MKRASLFIVLGAAFVAVSLWYLLSAGRSKRATRLKYRLGGALLSIGLVIMYDAVVKIKS